MLRLAALACATALPTLCAIAQEPSPAPSPTGIPATLIKFDARPPYREAVQHLFADALASMDRQHAPGMALALTDRKSTIAVLSLGEADVAHHVRVTAQTRFGIGSITKSMVALSLLEAHDEGRFDPQAPVTRYLPWFAVRTRWRPLTSHDLLTHTSGLPDGGFGYGAPYVVAQLRDLETGFAPGTHWSYSNLGYETLGEILAKVDRTSWEDALRAGIFAPIGMTSSAPDWTFATLRTAATGYLPREDDRLPDPRGWDLAPVPDAELSDAAGSVLATAPDMARYARVLLNGGVVVETGKRLISPASYRLLTTAATKAGPGGVPPLYDSYGYGLALQQLDGDRVIGHTGGTLPYTACLEADLSSGFAAVALTNVGAIAERPCAIVEQALRLLRAAAHGAPFSTLPSMPDPVHVSQAASYAGRYVAPHGAALTVVASHDRIALVENGTPYRLLPFASDLFWTDAPGLSLSGVRFLRDARTQRVDQLVAQGRWYATTAYHGPRTFPHPTRWDAYAGHYRFPGAHPYDLSMRVQVVKGALVFDDGTPLTPLADGSFRVGAEPWSPERVRFDGVIDGRAQRAAWNGVALYRVTTP